MYCRTFSHDSTILSLFCNISVLKKVSDQIVAEEKRTVESSENCWTNHLCGKVPQYINPLREQEHHRLMVDFTTAAFLAASAVGQESAGWMFTVDMRRSLPAKMRGPETEWLTCMYARMHACHAMRACRIECLCAGLLHPVSPSHATTFGRRWELSQSSWA